jgi:aspartate racemase
MRTIGLIGGMSWESSVTYYQLINRATQRIMGGHHNAKSLMTTVDFAEIEAMQRSGRWEDAGELLVKAGKDLEAGGAEILVLCTNTMHKVAPQIEAALPNLPFIHIADATAIAIKAQNAKRVGVLGTAYTMEQDFYKGRLVHHHGLEVLVPEHKDMQIVHSVIFDELVHGVINDSSRQAYEGVMQRLLNRGVEGVILGCTEIGMLVKPSQPQGTESTTAVPTLSLMQGGVEVRVPLYDTTVLHAEEAVRQALD